MRNVIKGGFLAFCLLWPGLSLAQTDKVAQWVRELDRQRFEAQIKKDTARLNQLLADDLIYTHSSAVVETKPGFVANVANGKWDYRQANLSNVQVRVMGQTAIITGRGDLVMGNNGQPQNVNLLFTNVYVKRKGQWRMVSWHSCRLPQN
ncbi:MAG: nuclear transport factor 2 family protein [Bernardetiaceae bacterium]|nr:nuclear transport factor 2 family protein [Bernardetiaceae bacterium]